MLKVFDKNITKKIKQMSKVCFRTYILNAICDVAYFKWQPTNTGCVFQPNSSKLLKIFNKFLINLIK